MNVYVNDTEVKVNGVDKIGEDKIDGILKGLRKYSKTIEVKKVIVSTYSGDKMEYYDLVEVVLSKVYGDSVIVDEYTKYNLGNFLTLMNDRASRAFDEKDDVNPIGFDDWLLKLSIDHSELFKFLSEWDYTKDYVENFDYNIKNDSKVEEIATKIYYATYNGRDDLLENYFTKYIELNGGIEDDKKRKIVSIMEDHLGYDLDGTIGDNEEIVGDYEKMLNTFKLSV